MDSHKVSVLPQRLTVVEFGRRRRWSEEEKLRIVMESLAAPRLVSAVARRHGITRSLLSDWRRTLKVERMASEPGPVPAFVPAVVVPEPATPAKAAPRRRAPRQAAQGRMVIEVGRRRHGRRYDGRPAMVLGGEDNLLLGKRVQRGHQHDLILTPSTVNFRVGFVSRSLAQRVEPAATSPPIVSLLRLDTASISS